MDKVAALASGGLDSSVLLADLARDSQVYPLYVREGLAWEEAEQGALRAFLAALGSPNVHLPITVLSIPIQPVYGDHWSITGQGVPGAEMEDAAVELPGRNILLLGLAAVWCSIHQVSRIAIGSLGGNPFPDATPHFFESYARVLSQGLGHPITIVAPYRGLHKEDLIRQHSDLPLGLTLTCMAPRRGVHCGVCNKCHERQTAFHKAGVPDPTAYAALP